jgi:hypothetical protein
MDALVSGWLKPIFLRFPVGFDEELPLLALVLELVVPQAARTGPATARVAPARPTRLTKFRRDSNRSLLSWPSGSGALDTCGSIRSMSASAGSMVWSGSGI